MDYQTIKAGYNNYRLWNLHQHLWSKIQRLIQLLLERFSLQQLESQVNEYD